MSNDLWTQLQDIKFELNCLSKATGHAEQINPNTTILKVMTDIWAQHNDNHKALLLAIMRGIRSLLFIL